METVESGPMIGQTIEAQSNVKRKCQCKEENACKWDRFVAPSMTRRSERMFGKKSEKLFYIFFVGSRRRWSFR